MDAENIAISVNVPAVQFESNSDLQSKNLHDGDSTIRGFRRKSLQYGGHSQTTREILTSFLSTQIDNVSDNVRDNVEKLNAENVAYRDLASLTHRDLELIGFDKPKQIDELLNFFAKLPNQDRSLQQIYYSSEAFKYNQQIINKAASHLHMMETALASANYKFQITPPDDLVIGEKSFASRFLIEALNELYDVASDINTQISEVESMFKEPQSYKNTKKKFSKIFTTSLISLSIVSIGAILALYYVKFHK